MRYLSLFSGIGAFETALKRQGIEYELVGFSEIDKYAIKSYCAIHDVDESLNLGDITKIDITKLPKDIDLITHGSPCQDFSIAGKLAGGDKGSGTRSSLMWCTVDIVEAVHPKYVIWENVKNVLSAKNRHNFDGYIQVMKDLGYNSYYQVLNAKDYGIPQNRERVFTVSIRKDIDSGYIFPEKQELKLRLKDMLEETVDEKYYLSDTLVESLIAHTTKTKDDHIQLIGELDIKGHDCVKRVYGVDGVAPTLTDMQGGNRQPKILEDFYKNRPIREYSNVSPTLRSERIGLKVIEPVIAASRGRNPENPSDRTPGAPTEQRLEINKSGTSNTITTVQKDNYVIEPYLKIKEATKLGYKEAYEGDGVNISGRMKYQRGNVQKGMCQTIMSSGNERGVVVLDEDHDEQEEYDDEEDDKLLMKLGIRKLTPRECWKLMGFDDEDFNKAKAVPTSDTQLYKQAGNSIVVNVLEAIFKNLFPKKEKKPWYR